MGSLKPDELPRRYDLGFLPESRKMSQIARHQIVGARGIGTLQEPNVIGITCYCKTPGRYNQLTSVTDELQQKEKAKPLPIQAAKWLTLGLSFGQNNNPSSMNTDSDYYFDQTGYDTKTCRHRFELEAWSLVARRVHMDSSSVGWVAERRIRIMADG